MEEQSQNQLATLTPDQKKLDMEKKSLNRRFGLILGLSILLGICLVVEIVLLFIR